MPFEVRKRGDKYVVVNAQTGDVKGTHDTKLKANRQLRALYANAPEAQGGGKKRG